MAKKTFGLILLLLTLVTPPVFALCGKFNAVIKDVSVIHNGANAPATIGSSVCSGDSVVAGTDSRASVTMEDQNVLNISPDTKIVVENYEKKKVMINILNGKMRTTIPPANKYDEKDNTFQVKTKSAVAGVRGTDFVGSFAPSTGKSQFVDFSGQIVVGKPGPGGGMVNAVTVGPGMMTQAGPGQPPAQPKVVPPQDLKNLNSQTSSSASNSSSSSSSGNTASATSKTNSARSPASNASSGNGGGVGSSMVDSTDSSGGAQMKPSAGGPAAPTLPTLPPPPALPPGPVQNSFVNQNVLGGNLSNTGPALTNVRIHY